MGRNSSTLPLSLYVHIPWCIRKCPYCDFNSHAIEPSAPEHDLPEEHYLAALETDLMDSAWQSQGRELISVFFGGGTPSLFSAEAIGRILYMASEVIGLAGDCEVTIEANPGTFEQQRFSGYRQSGVNRLSIGVQSFDNRMLESLGRIHDANEARDAFSAARRAGFDNINLDLMYGLPHQNQAQALRDLEEAVALRPEHISWYELTLEPNTYFFRHPPNRPDADHLADMSDSGIRLLADAGYRRYEISAFAEKDRRSRHNLNYWQFGDYIGIGAGAHSKFTDLTSGEITRQAKTRQPGHYIERIGSRVATETTVARDDILGEYMMNALRLPEGTRLSDAATRTGLDAKDIETRCREGLSRGLLELGQDRIQPSDQGQRLLNLCLQSFLVTTHPP